MFCPCRPQGACWKCSSVNVDPAVPVPKLEKHLELHVCCSARSYKSAVNPAMFGNVVSAVVDSDVVHVARLVVSGLQYLPISWPHIPDVAMYRIIYLKHTLR